MNLMNNKWLRAAIPALLIHCSIGTVYCWSTFKEAIANYIGVNTFATGWAFSFAIFFLGMSAAFAGKFVELDIHKSSLVSCICFTTGMIGTGLSIQFLKGGYALVGIYMFYGCIMGIGLGVGYLTPVKTLMLWFEDQKGLATGISIMGFGLAKAIATPIMEFIQAHTTIYNMFYILGVVYCVMIFIGHLLLKKPDGWIEDSALNDQFSIKEFIKNRKFILIWFMFFINIHCGLMFISYEKQIIQLFIGVSLVAIIPSITALSNALGRFGYATLSDKLKDRSTVYGIIFISCLSICLAVSFTQLIPMNIMVLMIVLLLIVNLGYGGGFSTLPALLSQYFGMENISKVHGLALSAWGIAGITGNNTSEIILRLSNNNYMLIVGVAFMLYSIANILKINLRRCE